MFGIEFNAWLAATVAPPSQAEEAAQEARSRYVETERRLAEKHAAWMRELDEIERREKHQIILVLATVAVAGYALIFTML